MKILITGANGQLGRSIIEFAPKSYKLLKPDRNELNLEEQENCYKYVIKNKPDWIINCAAYTQVDRAEREKELAFKINRDAPITFANALKTFGGKILQISTDYVFNGKNNYPYTPFSEKSPINAYGFSKALAEDGLEKILFSSNQAIILRTSWLIGPYKNNFLKKMLEFHQNKETINIVFDQISSPTSSLSLAEVCWKTIHNQSQNKKNFIYPILHWSDLGIASWYDLSFFIGETALELGLITKKAKINPITSNEYKTLAKRPNYSVLDSRVTRSFLNIDNNHWQKEIIKICNKIKKVQKSLL